MSIRKFFGGLLAAGTQAIPLFNAFAPLIAAAIPGDKDDKAIARVGGELQLFTGIVMEAQATGEALADKGITGADKAKIAGRRFGQIILSAMQAMNFELDDETGFVTKCETLAGAWSDVMDCFKKK